MAGRRLLPGVSVVKNKDGSTSYRASGYTPTGRKVAKTFRTIKGANEYKRDLEYAKDHGTFVDPNAGKVTLADYFAESMARSPSLSPKTVHSYWTVARNWILPAFGQTPLAKITRDGIATWIADLDKNAGAATTRLAYRVLSRTLSRAEDEGRIVRNPARHMASYLPAKPSRRDRVRVLTREEVRAVADEVDERYRALVFGPGISRSPLRRGDQPPTRRRHARDEGSDGGHHGSGVDDGGAGQGDGYWPDEVGGRSGPSLRTSTVGGAGPAPGHLGG